MYNLPFVEFEVTVKNNREGTCSLHLGMLKVRKGIVPDHSTTKKANKHDFPWPHEVLKSQSSHPFSSTPSLLSHWLEQHMQSGSAGTLWWVQSLSIWKLSDHLCFQAGSLKGRSEPSTLMTTTEISALIQEKETMVLNMYSLTDKGKEVT